MHRLLAAIALVAVVSLSCVEQQAFADHLYAGPNQPGGCWHYGRYYNPQADYGPYYRGVRKPVLKWGVKYLCGVPYPGYYYGPAPGCESRRPGCPYSAQFGGLPSISSTYPGMEYIARRKDEASNTEAVEKPPADDAVSPSNETSVNGELQFPSADNLESPKSSE